MVRARGAWTALRSGDRAGYATWSEAVIASLEKIAADLDGVGLDSADVRKVAAVAAHDRAVLDDVTEPRLLIGDLWTVNCLLDPGRRSR